MSYEIIYNKQFIKVSEKEFIPVILAGSNNCYETSGRGAKRARSWENWRSVLGGKIIGTLEEMVQYCENYRKELIERNKQTLEEYPDWDEYSDNSWGWYSSVAIGRSTSKTTYGMFKGIFITGCKQAMTVEELKENGIGVVVKNGYINFNDKETERISMYPKTTEELLSNINELTEIYKDKNVNVLVTYFTSDERIKEIQKRRNRLNKQERVKIKQIITEYFTIRIPNYGYYIKGTKRGFRYTYYHSYQEKRFYTEKSANKFCEQLKLKYTHDFTVEKVSLSEPKEILI